MKKIEGNIIDIYNNRIFPGTICIDHGIITDILENSNSYQNFIAPGFIDAHVHIESSMLVPEEFSKQLESTHQNFLFSAFLCSRYFF